MAFDPQQFATTLLVDDTAPIPALQRDIEALRGFDRLVEGEESKYGKRGCIFGALTFASLFLLPITMGISLLLTIPLVVFLVLSIKSYVRFSRQNTENRRYELVSSALRLLAADTGEESPVALHLDLRPADRKETRVREGKVGVWSVTWHEHAWLRMRGRLLDGTSWTLSATERLQVRRKTYRTSRGKTKSKTKKKSATVFGLALDPKEKRYGSMAGLAQQAQAAVQLPPWAGTKRVTAEADGLVLKTLTKTMWDEPAPGAKPGASKAPRGSQLVGMMFLSLYQLLHTSRRMAG
jgi:hypothetical protein